MAVLLAIGQIYAQQRTITGKVTDDKGNPVPNASVAVKGTTTGTVTKADGTYSLTVPASAKTLVISSVSMKEVEVDLGSKSVVNVSLQTTETSLQEVVVTALGITRDKRSLGYASQNLKGDELANRGEVNIVNSLQGKVAGVNITNASGGAGASVNINIRGVSSFTGSNQPLFVIDGIPISNDVDRTNSGPNGTLGDNQPANRALDIDMNNVESVNILKGPAAAALYGSRASAGAIIITTKKGGSAKGKAEIILNSSYSIQNAFGLPKVQNLYGQGAGGVFSATTNNSFGPKFGSTPSLANGLILGAAANINGVNYTAGQTFPYAAFPDNINDFFRRGTIAENNITLNTGDAVRNQTFSIGNVTQRGILYNTTLQRTDLRFGANAPLGEKVKVGGSITYINTAQKGTLGGNNSGLASLLGLARNIDLTSYRVNRTYKNANGTNNYVLPGVDNPYFDQFENPLTSNLNRFTGNINIGYDLLKWLNISYRLGGDMYTDRRKQIFAISSGRVPLGNVREEMFFRNEINGDLIIRASKNNLFIHDLNVSGLIGQNINQRRFQDIAAQADQLAIPGFYNASNGAVFSVGTGETSSLRRLLGYYAQASFNYKNYAFLELTGRADNSSTLPKNKNTYFYPSANISFVFTDALKIKSRVFSYGKIRANYAKVGRDADPYLLSNLYVSGAFGNNVASFNFPFGTSAGFAASSRIAPIELSPEFKTSYEAGVNLQFFNNRASLDVTYYSEDSKSQILNVAIAPSTGFRTFTTNIGELTNKGVEVTASATIFRTKTFTWDLNANYTQQRNMVVSIAPGVDNTAVPGSAFIGSIPSFKVGYHYGVIIGGVIPRSPDGQRIINPATGLYQPTVAGNVLADPNPDYQVGVTNTLNYKGINLGFTFDFTKGGQVLSFTAASYKSRGALDITAVDREQPHILPGVILDPATGKYYQNNIQIPGQTYWNGAMGGLQSEFNVFDATVLHLREVTLGYDIPHNIAQRLKLSGLRFGIFARNVFYVAPNSPIDPQLNTQGAGNIRGLDLQGTPNARTIGANLKITL
jgi:TonB-linked SusC/RagA family outer membrane protein